MNYILQKPEGINQLSAEEARGILGPLLFNASIEYPYGPVELPEENRSRPFQEIALEVFLPAKGYVGVVEGKTGLVGAFTLVPLPFDSANYGVQMGKLSFIVDRGAREQDLREVVTGAFAHAQRHAFNHVAMRVYASQIPLINGLVREGAYLTGTHVVLWRDIVDTDLPAPDGRVEDYHPRDLEALVEIGRVSFRESRFHRDSYLSQELSDHLHQSWVRNDVEGRAQKVFIVRNLGKPVGFIACIVGRDISQKRAGLVDLIAVHPKIRGMGIGSALLSGGLHWMKKEGCQGVWVDTQASNLASLALYQRMKFHVARIDLDVHRWFRE